MKIRNFIRLSLFLFGLSFFCAQQCNTAFFNFTMIDKLKKLSDVELNKLADDGNIPASFEYALRLWQDACELQIASIEYEEVCKIQKRAYEYYFFGFIRLEKDLACYSNYE